MVLILLKSVAAQCKEGFHIMGRAEDAEEVVKMLV
jgi:hypothetical protein